MELCCTYIETNKFMEVISFYEKILQIKPNIYTENRWVEFECGNKLAIYNRKFDEEKISSRNNVNYNDAYIKDFNKEQNIKMNNIITLNFYTEDLNEMLLVDINYSFRSGDSSAKFKVYLILNNIF